jgi:hypothetical protein
MMAVASLVGGSGGGGSGSGEGEGRGSGPEVGAINFFFGGRPNS